MTPNGYNLRSGGGRSEKLSDESKKRMVSTQREISLSKNGKLGYVKKTISKIDGRITSWSLCVCRNGIQHTLANSPTLDDILKVQDEFTKDPDGYTISEPTHMPKAKARGVYYNEKRNKWIVNYTKYIGTYSTEEEANDVLKKYKDDPSSFVIVKQDREYVGVNYRKKTGKWRSSIFRNGKLIDLGYYTAKDEAADARKRFIDDPDSFVRPNQRKKIKL